jgi:hypothetical protein
MIALCKSLLLCGVALVAAAACAPPKESPMDPDLPKARDGNVAIQQELEAARRAATAEAYDLFIARHPDHALAEVARRERNLLVQPRDR